jgi:hypothetical protein
MRKREIERRERARSLGKNPRARDRKKRRDLEREPSNPEEPEVQIPWVAGGSLPEEQERWFPPKLKE